MNNLRSWNWCFEVVFL